LEAERRCGPATNASTHQTDPLLNPLRKEPQLQAVERELRFPD
jgi:hypothetical protein